MFRGKTNGAGHFSRKRIFMTQPVWVLSVDLQTKTATFQSGMADAAKAARGSFDDIKTGAREMGGEVNVSMTEARHGVMLLGRRVWHSPSPSTYQLHCEHRPGRGGN